MNHIANLPIATDSTNSSSTFIAELVEPTSFYSSSSHFDLSSAIYDLQASSRSRDGLLFSILASAYKVYVEIESATEAQQSAYLDELETLRVQAEITTKPRKTYTKIITLIFANSEIDRQLISSYGNVLKNAFIASTKVEEFTEWLEEVGGIDAASRLNRQPREQKAPEDSLQYLNYIAPIGKASGEKMSKYVKDETCEFKLTVCRWNQATSEMEIYKIVEDEEIIKAVFAPFADEVKREAVRALDFIRAKSTTPTVKVICLPSPQIEQQ